MTHQLLILDDEELIRESLKDFFEDMGWDVYTFAAAEEALAFLNSQSVDYMTVDLRLPGMNGVDFIVQAYSRHPEIKCVIYTGSINFILSDDLKRLGLSDNKIVRKPVMEMMDIFHALTA